MFVERNISSLLAYLTKHHALPFNDVLFLTSVMYYERWYENNSFASYKYAIRTAYLRSLRSLPSTFSISFFNGKPTFI